MIRKTAVVAVAATIWIVVAQFGLLVTDVAVPGRVRVQLAMRGNDISVGKTPAPDSNPVGVPEGLPKEMELLSNTELSVGAMMALNETVELVYIPTSTFPRATLFQMNAPVRTVYSALVACAMPRVAHALTRTTWTSDECLVRLFLDMWHHAPTWASGAVVFVIEEDADARANPADAADLSATLEKELARWQEDLCGLLGVPFRGVGFVYGAAPDASRPLTRHCHAMRSWSVDGRVSPLGVADAKIELIPGVHRQSACDLVTDGWTVDTTRRLFPWPEAWAPYSVPVLAQRLCGAFGALLDMPFGRALLDIDRGYAWRLGMVCRDTEATQLLTADDLQAMVTLPLADRAGLPVLTDVKWYPEVCRHACQLLGLMPRALVGWRPDVVMQRGTRPDWLRFPDVTMYHIPKTGGTSVEKSLSEIQWYVGAQVQLKMLTPGNFSLDDPSRMASHLPRAPFAWWHVPPELLEPLADVYNASVVFCMVRHPITRFVSALRFNGIRTDPLDLDYFVDVRNLSKTHDHFTTQSSQVWTSWGQLSCNHVAHLEDGLSTLFAWLEKLGVHPRSKVHEKRARITDSVISPKLVAALVDVYRVDFVRFNYTIPDVEKPVCVHGGKLVAC